MTLKELSRRALEIRERYGEFETERIGRPWSNTEIALGFVGDVGDLARLVMAKEGLRGADDLEVRLAHELADCLWCLLVLSEKYGVDLEREFLGTMEELEGRIAAREAH